MINKSDFINHISQTNTALSVNLVEKMLEYTCMETIEKCATELASHQYLEAGYDILSIGYLKFFDNNKPIVLDFIKKTAAALDKQASCSEAAMREFVTSGSGCGFEENLGDSLTIGKVIAQTDEDDYNVHADYDAVAEFCLSECVIEVCRCYATLS